MIKPNELRIGNLFTDEFENIIELAGIEPEGIKDEGNNLIILWFTSKDDKYFNDYFLDGIAPIRITEEWLLRFGFNNFVWGWVKVSLKDIGLRIKGGDKFYFERSGESLLQIEHVHQLQNLYFALTGEELTIE